MPGVALQLDGEFQLDRSHVELEVTAVERFGGRAQIVAYGLHRFGEVNPVPVHAPLLSVWLCDVVDGFNTMDLYIRRDAGQSRGGRVRIGLRRQVVGGQRLARDVPGLPSPPVSTACNCWARLRSAASAVLPPMESWS